MWPVKGLYAGYENVSGPLFISTGRTLKHGGSWSKGILTFA